MSFVRAEPLYIAEAEDDLRAFAEWLASHATFTEQDVVAFMKERKHLFTLFCATAGGYIPDRLRHEMELHGLFRADLVGGNTSQGRYTFIEFESGRPNSLFKSTRPNQNLADWSNELHHALGQVSDWEWARQQNFSSNTFEHIFGRREINVTYLVICGRRDRLDKLSTERLAWRSNNTLFGGHKTLIWTFDDALEFALEFVESQKLAAQLQRD